MLDSSPTGFSGMQDQAAGLRRLLGKAPLRAVVVAGSGATTLTVNLAAALGAGGMDVLIVDENANHGNVSDHLGVAARYELIHALDSARALQDVICEAAAGVRVLPAARGARELMRVADGRGFSDCMRSAGAVPDLLLVDSASGGVSQLLRGIAACEIVIVTGAAHGAITAAYGLIKNAAREFGDSRFQIVVNRARDAAEAEAIYRNMSAVARKHVGARLEFLGWVPNDPQCRLARTAQTSLVATFPESAAAGAVRALAKRLRSGGAAVSAADRISKYAAPADGDAGHPPAVAGAAGRPLPNQPWRTTAAIFS